MTIEEQLDVLMQGTDYGDAQLAASMRRELKAKLEEGRPLRVYCGYDPTSTDLHLGHTISMRKLRQFQDFGHEVTFLIGNYTALVGDPSDKNKARPILTEEQVAKNGLTFAEQAFRILDPEKTQVKYNKDWLSKLSLLDIIRLGQTFTVQQFLTRDNFAKRLDKGEPIYLHETFYAIMQGYDAVAQETDVQVGGRDQLFNIVVSGRKLQESFGQKPQVAIISGILPGTDGIQRMSKSQGNHIPIASNAEDMYGKVMSLPDSAMPTYYKLVTRFAPEEIAHVEATLADGSLHPRDGKMKLAFEITEIFYGTEGAEAGAAHFKKVIQQGGLPDDMPEVAVEAGTPLVDLLTSLKFASSKSEARRSIQQGSVRFNNEKQTDINLEVTVEDEIVMKVGKRKFARLTPK